MKYVEPHPLNSEQLWLSGLAVEISQRNILPVDDIDDFADRLSEVATGARRALEQASDSDFYDPKSVGLRLLRNIVERTDEDLRNSDPRDPLASVLN